MAGRRVDIDILRITGALFVVIYHFGIIFTFCEEWASAYIEAFLSCCVPIFFFVSGILHSNKKVSCKVGFGKALKIMALAVAWGAILWLVVSLQNRTQITPNLWVAGVLTFQQDYTNMLWFLPAMAIVYMLAPVFCVLRENSRGVFQCTVFGVCSLVFGLDLLQRGGASLACC